MHHLAFGSRAQSSHACINKGILAELDSRAEPRRGSARQVLYIARFAQFISFCGATCMHLAPVSPVAQAMTFDLRPLQVADGVRARQAHAVQQHADQRRDRQPVRGAPLPRAACSTPAQSYTFQ